MKSFVFAILLACVAVAVAEKARFDNYRVYSIVIENEDQLNVLQELERHQDGLQFLEAPISTKRNAEIIVPPHKLADIVDYFERNDLKHSIKYENLQK